MVLKSECNPVKSTFYTVNDDDVQDVYYNAEFPEGWDE